MIVLFLVVVCGSFLVVISWFFFFKQKTAYEMRISDWSSDVCSSDLFFCTKHAIAPLRAAGGGSIINLSSIYGLVGAPDLPPYHASKGAVRLMSKTIGRASCRERVWQYV